MSGHRLHGGVTRRVIEEGPLVGEVAIHQVGDNTRTMVVRADDLGDTAGDDVEAIGRVALTEHIFARYEVVGGELTGQAVEEAGFDLAE